jgi:hypothetical protein
MKKLMMGIAVVFGIYMWTLMAISIHDFLEEWKSTNSLIQTKDWSKE